MNIKTMENKVRVWVARDKDGKLFAFSNIPLKKRNIWSPSTGINIMQLKSDKFPSIKWEDDEPTEAYITLAEPQEQPKQEQPAPEKEIDWEKRRYEIAKEMMPVLYRQGVEVLKYGQKFKWDGIVDGAVNFADMLIEKLKKGGER